jgi:hypothetical protein
VGAALVIPLVKGLADTVNTNGIFVVIVRDVTVLAIIVIVFVALSKGLVIAITLPLRPCTVVRVGGIRSGCFRYQNLLLFHASVDQAQPAKSVLWSNCFLVDLVVAIRHSPKIWLKGWGNCPF